MSLNTKKEIRTQYRRLRDSVDEVTRKHWNLQMSAVFQTSHELKAKTIFTFMPIGSEPDILHALLSSGAVVCVPKVSGSNMNFFAIDRHTKFDINSLGIPEPISNKLIEPDEDNSIIFVPALAVDKHGHRIGYGKGFYDRYLECFPNITAVGIAYEICIYDSTLSIEAHDKPLNGILTEKSVTWFDGS
jgi:5-formyltetrahydrofolate cyclo-ligase